MKRLQALVLAGIMILGLGMQNPVMTVQAEEPPVLGNPTNPSITKKLEVADGITVPTVTFEFDVRRLTTESKAPNATIQPITYDSHSAKELDPATGKYILSKQSNIVFSGAFPHAGVYEYVVTEKAGLPGITQNDSMIYSTDQYKLSVYVANNEIDGATFVKSITAIKNPDELGNGSKVGEIIFTNVYKKEASLIIQKKTTGTFADKTKKFPFTITMHKSPTASDNLEGVSGLLNGVDKSVKYGVATTFELADGEKLEFGHLPAGTTFTVTEEAAVDGYTPSVEVIENGTKKQFDFTQVKDESALSTGKTLVGENTNSVTFTNKYEEIPMTGIIMNNLPFIVMIAVAFVGLAALLLVKSKKRSK